MAQMDSTPISFPSFQHPDLSMSESPDNGTEQRQGEKHHGRAYEFRLGEHTQFAQQSPRKIGGPPILNIPLGAGQAPATALSGGTACAPLGIINRCGMAVFKMLDSHALPTVEPLNREPPLLWGAGSDNLSSYCHE